YADPGEDPAVTAVREVEEETGWRPRSVEFLLSFQPMVGSADAPQDLYLAHGADLVGEPVRGARRTGEAPSPSSKPSGASALDSSPTPPGSVS
ncbi:NUDIX domain-containing protein, partial [Actinomadura chokoriensis]|uniref:NUDIX domain-containing protein n=1 Tax=Actinomadura chokoriensis TaxID=454156 RepID=UPI0031F9CE5C